MGCRTGTITAAVPAGRPALGAEPMGNAASRCDGQRIREHLPRRARSGGGGGSLCGRRGSPRRERRLALGDLVARAEVVDLGVAILVGDDVIQPDDADLLVD